METNAQNTFVNPLTHFTPRRERISTIRELADHIRYMNKHSFDHWTLNDSIFFGDFGGTYATVDLYGSLYGRSSLPSLRGFIEIPDEKLEEFLRKEWEITEEFHFNPDQDFRYQIDIIS